MQHGLAELTIDSPTRDDASEARLRVSVIITNYNYARFVGDAIRSVLAQTHPDVECIVVDDGSIDDSRQVIAQFRGVTALYRDNVGQARAARAGVAHATGGIIIFLDADDALLPEACAEVAARWRAGVATIQYRLTVRRNGTDSGETLPSEPFVHDAAAFIQRYGYLPCAPMSGNAYSRAAAEEILATGLHLRKHGLDAWMTLCAPLLGDVVVVDRPLGIYRIHGENISLAAGKTLHRVKARLFYQYWAQQSVALLAADPPSDPLLKGPHNLKWYLLTRHLDGGEFEIPQMAVGASLRACCRDFLTYPAIAPVKRVANCLIVVACTLLPRAARTIVLRRFYRLDV